MLNKEFISYKQALALKELGFDDPCFNSYDQKGELMHISVNWKNSGRWTKFHSNRCTAPLFQQVFDFFREKYKLNCFVVYSYITNDYYYHRQDLTDDRKSTEPELVARYATYKEAQSACLNKLILIVKNRIEDGSKS